MLINVKMPTNVIKLISFITSGPGLEIIKLEYSLRLKIKRNDWLFADMLSLRMNSSFITSRAGFHQDTVG